MRKIWDNNQVIGEVQKSEGAKLVVSLSSREGVKYISIRGWYKKKSDNEWKPALDGISVPIAANVLGENEQCAAKLACLIADAINKAPGFALEDEANAVWAPKSEVVK